MHVWTALIIVFSSNFRNKESVKWNIFRLCECKSPMHKKLAFVNFFTSESNFEWCEEQCVLDLHLSFPLNKQSWCNPLGVQNKHKENVAIGFYFYEYTGGERCLMLWVSLYFVQRVNL